MKYEAAINVTVRFDVDEDKLVEMYGPDWRDIGYLPNELAHQLGSSISMILRENSQSLADAGWKHKVTYASRSSAQGAVANKSRYHPVTTTFMPQTTLSLVQRWNAYTHSVHESRMNEDLERFSFLARRVPTWDGSRSYVFPELDETNGEEIRQLFVDITETLHEAFQDVVDSVARKAFLEYLEGCEEDGIQGAKKPEPVTTRNNDYI